VLEKETALSLVRLANSEEAARLDKIDDLVDVLVVSRTSGSDLFSIN